MEQDYGPVLEDYRQAAPEDLTTAVAWPGPRHSRC